MGNLTTDMKRLCTEVVRLRQDRRAAQQHLVQATRDRAAAVATQQAEWAVARKVAAKQARAERLAFKKRVTQEAERIKKDVTRTRQAIAADLAGAQRAWLGKAA